MSDNLPAVTDGLLEMAISKDLDITKLEKLIELKNAEEERQCKKDFDFHFSQMQKEFEPIDRTKDGYSSKYAPLALMVKKYATIITAHGLSYRWRESAIESGKRVTIIISGWGHTDDETYFDVPHIEGTKQMNAIQVKGALSSYGQRYTFKAGFGITEIDEDTDGNFTFDDGLEYANDIELIKSFDSLDKLRSYWKIRNPELDNKGRRILVVYADKKKEELTK